MFRIISPGNSMPHSWIVDPSCQFQAGSVGQLIVLNNIVMCTVSDGSAPIGIIDDIKTNAFYANVWHEEKITKPIASAAFVNGVWITTEEVTVTLDNAYVVRDSFASNISVALNERNGLITFMPGTPLNYDLGGTGQPNAIKTLVNYTYRVPNVPGDDTTIGSNRVTIWFERVIFQTDQFETNQIYAVNAPLYVNERGLFTSRQVQEGYPAMAMVTMPPSTMTGFIEAIWL